MFTINSHQVTNTDYDHCNPSGAVMALCVPFIILTSTQHTSGVMANIAIDLSLHGCVNVILGCRMTRDGERE